MGNVCKETLLMKKERDSLCDHFTKKNIKENQNDSFKEKN